MMGTIIPVQCCDLKFYLNPEWMGEVWQRAWRINFLDQDLILTVESKHRKDAAPDRAKHLAKNLGLEIKGKQFESIAIFAGRLEGASAFQFQIVTTQLMPIPNNFKAAMDCLSGDCNYDYCFEVPFRTEYVWSYFQRNLTFLSINLAKYILGRMIFKPNEHKSEVRRLLKPQFAGISGLTLEEAQNKYGEFVSVRRKYRRKKSCQLE